MKNLKLILVLLSTLITFDVVAGASNVLDLGFAPYSDAKNQKIRYQARAAGHDLFLLDDGYILVGGGDEPQVLRARFQGAHLNSATQGELTRKQTLSRYVGNDPAAWGHRLPIHQRIRTLDLYPGVDWLVTVQQGSLVSDFEVAPGADSAAIEVAFSGQRRLELLEDGALAIHTEHGVFIEDAPYVYQDIAGRRIQVAARYTLRGDDRVSFTLGNYDRSHTLVIDPTLNYATYLGGAGEDQGRDLVVDQNGKTYIVGTTYSNYLPGLASIAPQQVNRYRSAYVSEIDAQGQMLNTTLIGGTSADSGVCIDLDRAGNVIIAGTTYSANFPLVNPIQATLKQHGDAYIAKISPTQGLVFSTFLGGSSIDNAYDVTVDLEGVIFVTGDTRSPDFPTSHYASQPWYGGGMKDAWVAKIDPYIPELSYSTYLGGSSDEEGVAITVDDLNNAYITGNTDSANFPTSHGQLMPLNDANQAFVTAFDGLSGRFYSQLFGGSSTESGRGIHVDRQGLVTIAGETSSDNLPTTPGVAQPTYAGSQDGYVICIDIQANTVDFLSYLGGSSIDWITDLKIDDSGSMVLTGTTLSSNYPTVRELYRFGGKSDAFITVLEAGARHVRFSTFYGSEDVDYGEALDVWGDGSIVATGAVGGFVLPVKNAFQNTMAGGRYDAYVVRIDQ